MVKIRPFLKTLQVALFSIISLACSALLTVNANIVSAQETEVQSPETNPDQMILGWRAELDQIESAVGRDGVTDQELIGFRDRVTSIRSDADKFIERTRPLVESLTTRLNKLSGSDTSTSANPDTEQQAQDEIEADNETAPEQESNQVGVSPANIDQATQALQEEQTGLETELSVANARLKASEEIEFRSQELLDRIKNTRRSKFASQLFNHSKSVLNPNLWIVSLKELPQLFAGFYTITKGALTRVVTDVPYVLIAALLGSALALLLLLTQFKWLRTSPSDTIDNSDLIDAKEWVAIRRVVRVVLLFVLIPSVTLFALDQVNALAPRLSIFGWAIIESLVWYALANGLSRAIFSPYRPALRLSDISDGDAIGFNRTIFYCTTIALIGFTLLDFAQAMVATLDVTVLLYGVSSIAFTLTTIATASGHTKNEDGEGVKISSILVIRIIAVFMLVALAIAFFAPILGYAFLGSFAVKQSILAGVIAGILYLIFYLLDKITSSTAADAETNKAFTTSRTSERRQAQALLLINGVFKIIIMLLGLLVFSATWGLDTVGIWEDLSNSFAEVRIGELTLSPATILTALILLVLGIILTRAMKRWFANRFLPTTTLDVGLRNSITTAIGYVGYALAAAVAFSQAGLDLSNLAIVAGALSLGIGFGLQSVVSNFVSGIILLAERPIKAGDWIEVGGEQGTVRKISVRSTEIETFDRATVIVPNADFISGSVKNMMYGNTIGRFIVTVGVGYDSDPDKVKEILLDCSKNHPLVLSYPEAYVVFSEFGASSLDFELRGYLADCGNGLSVKSDLRFAVLKRFREEGIEIPFPQRDLNIKGIEPLSAKEIDAVKQSTSKSESGTQKVTNRRDEIDDADDGDSV